MGGVGVHAVTFGHAADGCRIEPRRLDQDALRRLGDHRIEAAHDAGERDGLFGIRDDEVFGSELALDAIQRLQDFAITRAADDDCATFQQVEIEGVRRMAEFVQRVVGGVSDVVDGAGAEHFEALCDGFAAKGRSSRCERCGPCIERNPEHPR